MVEFQNKDEEIIDEEDYSSSSNNRGLTPKEIVLNHIKRLSQYIFSGSIENQGVENKKGEFNLVTDKKEVIIQAIDFLIALLQPYYDDDMTNCQKKFNNGIELNNKNLFENAVYDISYKEYRSKGGEYKQWYEFYRSHQIFEMDKNSFYYNKFVLVQYELYLQLFKDMNYLLKRINYLSDIEYGE